MRIADVNLNDFRSLTTSRVRYIERDVICAVTRSRLDLEIAVLKSCIGEPGSKWKEWFRPVMLVASITDEDAFLVYDTLRSGLRIVAVVCGIIFPAAFEGDWQTPRRINIAEQNFSERGSAFLARIPGF